MSDDIAGLERGEYITLAYISNRLANQIIKLVVPGTQTTGHFENSITTLVGVTVHGVTH